MPRRPRPLDTFGNELMSTLLTAGTRPVVFKLPYRQAVRFRHRIHDLRTAMREAQHPQLHLAQRVSVRVSWDPNLTEETRNQKGVPRPRDPSALVTVTVAVRDSEFTEVLKKAGVDTELSLDPLSDSTPQDDSPSLSTLESILSKRDH